MNKVHVHKSFVAMSSWKKYILWFAQEHIEFRAAVSIHRNTKPIIHPQQLSTTLPMPTRRRLHPC